MKNSAEEKKKEREKKVFAESIVECSNCGHLYRQAELANGHFSIQTNCPSCGFSGDHENLEFVLKDMSSGTISKSRKEKES